MLKELLFPNVCGFCGGLLEKGNICTYCEKEIPYYGFSYIPFHQQFYFDELVCNYYYEGIVRKKILDFKFEHQRYLCYTFAEGMEKRFRKIKPEFDMVIPVPIHWTRKMERGYNQSNLIARVLSKEIGVPKITKVLKKRKRNQKQSRLNKEERAKNVRNVFEVRHQELLKGKKVLLIDDIYTTGATVNECARLLKEAGATKVSVYTIAKSTINSHVD